MILKSLLTAFCIFVLWFFYTLKFPFSISQHQWQDNIINAEKFIFDEYKQQNIIIGSSLSSRIKTKSLPNFYNLSFSGQSIYDGLNILNNTKKLPKKIFIETNVLYKDENLDFKSMISSSFMNSIKQNIPLFRNDKQPIALINKKLINPLVNKSFEKIIYNVLDKGYLKEIQISTNKTITSFDKLLKVQINIYNRKVDSIKMDNKFNLLSQQLNLLEDRGVQIIFFEIPVNPNLVNLPLAKYLREKVIKQFPNSYFIKLPPDIIKYETSDGIHLTDEEATNFTTYFSKEVKKIKS
jgi:hypothetical protein